ncbi:aminotransferase class V-fold PLP-dependent enzyme [Pelagicoccus albus]|uniref:Aminotransferase class V-fold PLP-dependent enzyme n=1 Tax=Pelagicoccus albus TaxID=415222 RepID=A0A7X1E8U7_9BACT|nr:aminotransferase class V-fold PLP-dependent enzyme [Pelagicoccus albus]MBC2606681.1 aminotransferase class V-fold PLP-dependent enzyme [Pelagicoccus albus]
MPRSTVSRRDFTKVLAMGAAASGLAFPRLSKAKDALPPAATAGSSEAYWESIRAEFLMPEKVKVLNAANLCPSPKCVVDSLFEATRSFDRNPSYENRGPIAEGKESTRVLLAEFLNVTPEEIILARNTSEANNMVSLGLELKEGDEVILFGHNHPSNNAAWKNRAERYGFTIVEVPIVNPHPGHEAYLASLKERVTPRTKLISLTHLTNTLGDLFDAEGICAFAKENGILSHVDGAQSFGLLDLDLSKISPDFYTGSAHKWPCGPKEAGLLYVNARSQDRLWPCVISAGAGQVGISKTHECFGQRDEPALLAFGEALKFHNAIGKGAIEARSRELAQALMAGLAKLDGVELYTNPDPALSAAVVVFKPGDLDPKALADALYEKESIGCTARTGKFPGLRFSPHFYNLHSEIDLVLDTISKYLKRGYV